MACQGLTDNQENEMYALLSNSAKGSVQVVVGTKGQTTNKYKWRRDLELSASEIDTY